MPELPEVETIKRQLQNDNIINCKILKINQSSLKLRFNPVKSMDITKINNQIIVDVHRRNKYLIIETYNYFFVIHLGMTGQLLIEEKHINHKHLHFQIELDNKNINFIDPRRFGGVDIIEKTDKLNNYQNIERFKNLGIEPFSIEYNKDNFIKLLKLKKTNNIKKFLLDQSNICGIGNIYANEIMFLSNISPYKRIKELTKKEKDNLFVNIIKVLQKSIDLGGSTISDFKHINGSSGNMQNFYFVYDRLKQNCKTNNCNNLIEKIIQNGRSTYFCSNCQKK